MHGETVKFTSVSTVYHFHPDSNGAKTSNICPKSKYTNYYQYST